MCLAKCVDGDREHDCVADGLDELHGKLDQSAMEHASACTDAVRDVLSKLDADRLHSPRDRVEKDRFDRANGLAIGGDHGSSV
jgi:hypothetical protein